MKHNFPLDSIKHCVDMIETSKYIRKEYIIKKKIYFHILALHQSFSHQQQSIDGSITV